MKHTSARIVFFLGLLITANLRAQTPVSEDAVSFLREYCFDCHSEGGASGDLNLESLILQTPLVKNRSKWINVIEQTRNHVMPPEDERQPSRRQRMKLVTSLREEIDNFDYSKIHSPGYEVARRLTHEEYDNTISDLFGVKLSIASRFPSELAGESGFNNSGNTLFIQPILMERYISAADEITETLFPTDPEDVSQTLAFKRLFFRKPHSSTEDEEVARTILNRFVGRAYRRPLSAQERSEIVQRYRSHRNRDLSHYSAVRIIVRQTLFSRDMLSICGLEKMPQPLHQIQIQPGLNVKRAFA
ncbi:MAG: DUF1587 domain-containing protein, partial [Planctomycetota bacterium]